MTRHRRNQQSRAESVARLALDPQARRQLGEHALAAFWRDGAEPGRRDGLVLVLGVCPHPDCACVDAHLDGFPVDDHALEVVWQGESIRVRRAAGAEEAPSPGTVGWPVLLVVDIETGEVRPAEDAGAQPHIEWVRSEVDGAFLEHLHRLWMDVKGFAQGRPRRDIDLGDRVGGEHVGFDELFADERIDAYLHEGRKYLADSFFCPERGCDCNEVRVVFCDDEAEPGIAVGSVRVRLVANGFEALEILPEDGAPVALVTTLWRRFQQRHRVAEHLTRRLERVRSIDPRLLESQPAQARARPLPGRNDPCPCGSGRKYKKCCLGKEAAR